MGKHKKFKAKYSTVPMPVFVEDGLDGWEVVGLAKALHAARCHRSHPETGSDCVFYDSTGYETRNLWLGHARTILSKGMDPESILEGLAFATAFGDWEARGIIYTEREKTSKDQKELKHIQEVVSETVLPFKKTKTPVTAPEPEQPSVTFRVELEVKVQAPWDPVPEDAHELISIGLNAMGDEDVGLESKIADHTILSIDGTPAPYLPQAKTAAS